MTKEAYMETGNYPPSVAALLTYGSSIHKAEWPDYLRELGISEAHIGDLIRMATDPALLDADTESSEAWAPIHAWRALGQLRAVKAVEPLLELLDRSDNVWIFYELPTVLGMIGPSAIPTLSRWLLEPSRSEMGKHGVISSFVEIAKTFPEVAQETVTLLSKKLEEYRENGIELNAYLVEALCKLGAKEIFPLIERVFLEQKADLSIIHWDYVRNALELI